MIDALSASSDHWVVHCDGSAVPNPGRMGIGGVMIDPGGQRHTFSRATHLTGCNNEAELRALLAALQELKLWQASSVKVYSDNSVLVEQLTVAHCKPVVRLGALFDEARSLMATFDQVSLQWVPRHRNGEADVLARAALGLPVASVSAKVLKRQKKRR